MTKYTDNQIKTARQTNIIDFVRSQGGQVKRVSGNTYIIDGHSSLKATDNKFSWWSCDISGNAIDFGVAYYGMTPDQAIAALLSINNIPYTPTQPERFSFAPAATPAAKTVTAPDFTYSDDYRRAKAYLCQTRRLPASLVQRQIDHGVLRQDARGNACFAVFDSAGNHIADDVTGTGVKRFKQIKGSQGDNGFTAGNKKDPKQIVFTESSIDALSLAALATSRPIMGFAEQIGYLTPITSKSTLIISMLGLKINVLNHYATKYPDTNIVFATDNDDAGSKFIFDTLPAYTANRTCTVLRPIGQKDWNDILQAD